MTDQTQRNEGGNRSLMRGLAVLDCVGRHGDQGVRIADIVRDCGLERPTVYRLLTTLMACGYVMQVGRFRYALSATHGVSMNNPVDEVSRLLTPVIKRVSELTEDATFAVIREGTQSHCIARHIGTYPIQALTVEVGRRQPLGVGAAGLALLASLSDTESTKIIKANASALSAYGTMTPGRLHTLLKAARERGWSVVGNHVVSEILAVGIAVPALYRGMTAGISVAAPTLRMSPQRQLYLVKTLRHAVDEFIFR